MQHLGCKLQAEEVLVQGVYTQALSRVLTQTVEESEFLMTSPLGYQTFPSLT